jgi:hypothetical protein
MTFEPTQKGNPRKLTVKQHTFPSASIARFVNEDGKVQLFHKRSGKVLRAKPSDKLFCALRVWDQQAEAGFMKEVEDAFQALADEILIDRKRSLGDAEFRVINQFYCLWNIRARHKQGTTADPSLADLGVLDVKCKFTTDEQEHLEAHGIGVIRPDLTIPSRLVVSPRIRLELSREVKIMRIARWQVLQATGGDFIVPDNFQKLWLVPLSPTLCLWASGESSYKVITRDELAIINQAAIRTSIEHYFARDFSHCPLPSTASTLPH